MRSALNIGPKRVPAPHATSRSIRAVSSASPSPIASPASLNGRSLTGNPPCSLLMIKRSMASRSIVSRMSDRLEPCATLDEAAAAEEHGAPVRGYGGPGGELRYLRFDLRAVAAVHHGEEI